MTLQVYFSSFFDPLTKGQRSLKIEATNFKEVVEEIEKIYPGFIEMVCPQYPQSYMPRRSIEVSMTMPGSSGSTPYKDSKAHIPDNSIVKFGLERISGG